MALPARPAGTAGGVLGHITKDTTDMPQGTWPVWVGGSGFCEVGTEGPREGWTAHPQW